MKLSNVILAAAASWALLAAADVAAAPVTAANRLADRDLSRLSQISRPMPLRAAPAERAARPGELVAILVEPGALTADRDSRPLARAERVRVALDRHGIDRVIALDRRPAGPRLVQLASARPDFDAQAAAAELMSTGAFRAVAPNVQLDLHVTPNDPYLDYQWYLDPTITRMPEAWDLEQGDSTVVIAIMDNGFDLTHEDFGGKVWRNWGETPGDGIDDDDNGFIDDVHGWDFGNEENDPSAEPSFDPSDIDIGFHGTFVAGIAAAAANNAIGIAGAGWSCRYMPLKVKNSAGSIPLAAVGAAFLYAIDQGADVLNMSLGTPDTTARDFFQVLVNDATAAGVLCVASAGNSGVNQLTFPASCDGALAVGATDEFDGRASFSNFGTWVDIAAPGSSIWSTIADNYVIDDLSQIIYIYFFYWDGENPYMFGDGTSFAAPLTAGVAALVRAQRPELTPAEVALQLIATGDVLPFDQPVGPRLNAYRALSENQVAVPPALRAGFVLEAPRPNPMQASSVLAFTLSESGPVTLTLFDARGRRVCELARGWRPAGPGEMRWDGTDADGRPVGNGIYFAALEQGGRRQIRRLAVLR